MKQRRVVVTGLGAITPIGNNVNDFWNSLVNGKSGAGLITKFDTTNFKTKFGCEVKNYNPEDHFDKKEARKMDYFSQYALVTAEEAVKDSGVNFDVLDKDKIGVIWASGNGGFQTFEEQVTEFAKGDGNPRFNPFFIHKVLIDTAPGMISIKYGLRGVNYSTVSACASSNSAIVDAFNYIKWGKADMFITGGSEAAITPASIGGFGAMKALSTNNENHMSASRPFDMNRDGFVMGEGAGALILEEYEHAKARGAKIYAEVVGGGMTGDAYHITATHPDGYGAMMGMKLALEEAGIKATDLDYINAHATSTGLGDVSELKAVGTLLKENISKVNISATKSMTGHLLGAAGAIEGIAAILATKHDCIPPTINTKDIDPEIGGGFNLTLGKKVARKVNYALSNTFGFGGHNATVLFKKYE
ncbi:MAG TPA: beta-ketoacyl-ACP synthase II [Cytophagales bacterium]|nr:beta-ketoacyl-ACP synthase II [Cytophagales bacterium]